MESISKLDMRLFYSEEIFDISDCSVNDTGVLIRLKSKNMIVNARIATRYQIITMAHINVLYKIFRFLERIHQLS